MARHELIARIRSSAMTPDASAFTLPDADRAIEFDGWLLGSSSSQDPDEPRPRWTEVSIYVTAAGAYVVHVLGQTTVAGEHQRARTQICETAAAAVDALHQVDENDIRYITRTATAAARAASERDADFERAFTVQRVA